MKPKDLTDAAKRVLKTSRQPTRDCWQTTSLPQSAPTTTSRSRGSGLRLMGGTSETTKTLGYGTTRKG
jgi:hypothetical protein